MNCILCLSVIKRKNARYCSRSCWLSSQEYRDMRKMKKEEIYSKSSASLKGRVIPQHTRDAVSLATRKLVGPLHHAWNHDRDEQRKKRQASRLYYGLLGRVLKRSLTQKEQRTEEILGYSCVQLRAHLESQFVDGMSWENQGKGGWHVDHIRPICTFPLETSPSVVNALSNLRPLWEKENLSRSRKLP